MPDEPDKPDTLSVASQPNVSQPQPQSTPEQEHSDLEKLISEAEASAQRDRIESTSVFKPQIPVAACTHENTMPFERKRCKTCGALICPLCWSILDPNFCRACLNESDAELKSQPLTDTEGVTHEGRVIQPAPNSKFFAPRFGTLAKSISEMSDLDLEAYIRSYKELVRQAEVALDFRRVVLGSSQLEQAQRSDKQRRLLRNDKTKYAVKTLTVDKNTGKPKKQAASTADLVRMMEALRQLSENRLKKEQATKASQPQSPPTAPKP